MGYWGLGSRVQGLKKWSIGAKYHDLNGISIIWVLGPLGLCKGVIGVTIGT